MIVSSLIRRVDVYHGYKLHIEFTINFAQFDLGLDMVEVAGQKKKSASFRKRISFGGDKRDRTADLLNAIQALSQAVRVHTPVIGTWKMR